MQVKWLQQAKFAFCVLFFTIQYEGVCNAQIVPDATLPIQSTVQPQDNTQLIEGGTRAGNNLFHSFREFYVPINSTAFFNNPADVQNILTRVTGRTRSDINGIIKANGFANLFLINPNGIIFGPNARLDIGGSFIGSTANAIGFGSLGNFSATNPEAPSPLLTINPSALLFSQIQRSSIETRGLRVKDGKSLLLVGGNVSVNSGGLYAFGGRVELGGLAGIGSVGLNGNADNFSLSFPSEVNKSDIFLTNNAWVNVRAGNGGSIAINARNLEITQNSQVLAGIQSGIITDNSKAGNIDINATGTIFLTNSYIVNNMGANALGQGGDVNIKANILKLRNGGQVSTNTFGAGQGGNLTVDAKSSVELIGVNTANGTPSGLFAGQRTKSGTGNAGSLTINTPFLQIKDGANVSTNTFGAGQGGNLTVDAKSSVELIGENTANGRPSGLFARQETENATGNAGSLIINTPLLRVKDGANVTASTFGAGRGGDLKIDAGRIEVIGTASNGSGSQIAADTKLNATGAAGNLIINTNQLIVQNGGQLSANTSGVGRSGNLTVDATERVELTGHDANNKPSGLFTTQQTENATGNAGSLTINTPLLRLKDGAIVDASTFGAGQGGNLTVDAKSSVELIGVNTANGRPSGLFARQSAKSGTGNAGSLTINTPLLQVLDGANVSNSTSGSGRGGDLIVNAGRIEVIGASSDGYSSSSINAQATKTATGAAGNLQIKTDQLLVRNGGQVNVSTFGAGSGGNLTIDARTIEVMGVSSFDFGSSISAETNRAATGAAGNLTINTDQLLVRDGGQISTSTFGAGTGGNLIVNATSIVELLGVITFDNSIIPSGLFVQQNIKGATGNAGSLTIKTNRLLVQDGAAIAARNAGTGTAGNLTINANSINLDKNALLTADTRSNRTDVTQAAININSRDLILRRASSITTNARGSEVIGGNININTDVLGAFENSEITANSDNFRGGNINIKTQGIFLSPDSAITASGATSALSGNVNITTLADPSKDLVPLTVDVVDVARLVDDNICARTAKSSFTFIGRGGIPSSPDNPAVSNSSWEDWRLLSVSKQQQRSVTLRDTPISSTTSPVANQIVEAQGWVIDFDGSVILTAAYPVSLSQNNGRCINAG